MPLIFISRLCETSDSFQTMAFSYCLAHWTADCTKPRILSA